MAQPQIFAHRTLRITTDIKDRIDQDVQVEVLTSMLASTAGSSKIYSRNTITLGSKPFIYCKGLNSYQQYGPMFIILL